MSIAKHVDAWASAVLFFSVFFATFRSFLLFFDLFSLPLLEIFCRRPYVDVLQQLLRIKLWHIIGNLKTEISNL